MILIYFIKACNVPKISYYRPQSVKHIKTKGGKRLESVLFSQVSCTLNNIKGKNHELLGFGTLSVIIGKALLKMIQKYDADTEQTHLYRGQLENLLT